MAQTEGITVQIGVYSGRPNPEMSLTGEDAETVAGMLRRAIGAQATHSQPSPQLGRYYGFLIRTPPADARRLGVPEEVSIYEGVIMEPATGARSGWRDTAGLERFLLGQALRHDYRNLLEEAGVSTSDLTGETG